MKKRRVFALLLALLLPASVCVLTASADDEEEERNVLGSAVAAIVDEKVFSDNVAGDLMFAAKKAEVTGIVTGDVLFGGGTVKLAGTVGGNIRGAAAELSLGGAVTENVTVAGMVVESDKNFTMRDASFCAIAGETVVLYGMISNLYVTADTVYVLTDRTYGLHIKASHVYLAEGMTVSEGDIESANPVTLVSSDAVFKTESGWSHSGGKEATAAQLKTMGIEFDLEKVSVLDTILSVLLNAVMTAVLALFLAFVLKKESKVAPMLRKKPTKLLLFGLLLLFALPMAFVLLLTFVVTVPVAFLLFTLYVILLVNSEAIVAVLFAKAILPEKNVYLFAALFGAGIRIVSSLPVLGQLVSTACILFAFGWLWMLAFGKKEPELFVNEGTVVNDFTV